MDDAVFGQEILLRKYDDDYEEKEAQMALDVNYEEKEAQMALDVFFFVM